MNDFMPEITQRLQFDLLVEAGLHAQYLSDGSPSWSDQALPNGGPKKLTSNTRAQRPFPSSLDSYNLPSSRVLDHDPMVASTEYLQSITLPPAARDGVAGLGIRSGHALHTSFVQQSDRLAPETYISQVFGSNTQIHEVARP